jgi:uncharacterized protein YcnI
VKHRLTAGVAAVAAVALVVLAPMAAAHVTVNPGEAEKGGYAALTFRVPNERDDARTTTVEVNFPVEMPLASVRVQPKPGWEYEMERTTLDEPIDNHGEEITEVVTKVTWTGGVIGTTEFEEFNVSVGRLPEDADEMFFPAIQRYDSGEVVRWIEEYAEGEEEPENPAPRLTLVEPAEEGEGGAAATADGEAASGLTVENAATQDDVDGANTMGIVGIVVGLLGLIVGGLALVRSRQAPAAASTTTSSSGSSGSSDSD